MMPEIKYYHGGVKGLKKGDKILPPSVTGKSTLLQYAQNINPDCDQREDLVYITTDRKMAEIYAMGYPDGDVYRVIPDGDIEVDPDCLEDGLGYQCNSATVRAVIAVNVRFAAS